MGVRDVIAKTLAGIKAYHGSPHDFDRFDPKMIGKGEGAQAYGHGLYFAEREAVARHYRDALQSVVRPHLAYEGEKITPSLVERLRTSADPTDKLLAQEFAPTLLSRGKGSLDNVYAALQRATEQRDMWLKRKADWEARPPVASTYKPSDYEQFAAGQQKYIDKLQPALSRLELNKGGPTGKMYEVNIGADPKQFLDWDKPLRDQPNVLAQLPPSYLDATKKEAYNRALAATSKPRADQLWSMVKEPEIAPGGFGYEANKYMQAPEIASTLNERGIPGIKYLDGSSRGVGEGTSNYVVFPGSADLIDITKKYALPGVVGAGGMGALADQSQYEATP